MGFTGSFGFGLCNPLCTPGMGVNLWGASPLYENPNTVVRRGNQVLAEAPRGTIGDVVILSIWGHHRGRCHFVDFEFLTMQNIV